MHAVRATRPTLALAVAVAAALLLCAAAGPCVALASPPQLLRQEFDVWCDGPVTNGCYPIANISVGTPPQTFHILCDTGVRAQC